MRCKLCHSHSVVRYGTTKGIQRWRCKDCRYISKENGNLPGLKFPTEQIITAFKLRKAGLSLRITRERLITLHKDCYPSISTICEWERNPRLQAIRISMKLKVPRGRA